MEVEFFTLGKAAETLDVPQPTLRGWCDKLEELKIHSLDRNNRNERIFYEKDLEIFRFMKKQKDMYGRKVTTIDLAYTIYEMAMDEGAFELRKDPAVPATFDQKVKINEADIKKLIEDERFYYLMREVMTEVTTQAMKEAREDIKKELAVQIREDRELTSETYESRIEALLQKRDEKIDELLKEVNDLKKKQNESFWKKFFS